MSGKSNENDSSESGDSLRPTRSSARLAKKDEADRALRSSSLVKESESSGNTRVRAYSLGQKQAPTAHAEEPLLNAIEEEEDDIEIISVLSHNKRDDSPESVAGALDCDEVFAGRMTRSRSRARSTTPSSKLADKVPVSGGRSCTRKQVLQVLDESSEDTPSVNILKDIAEVGGLPLSDSDVKTPVRRGNELLANRLIASLFTPATKSDAPSDEPIVEVVSEKSPTSADILPKSFESSKNELVLEAENVADLSFEATSTFVCAQGNLLNDVETVDDVEEKKYMEIPPTDLITAVISDENSIETHPVSPREESEKCLEDMDVEDSSDKLICVQMDVVEVVRPAYAIEDEKKSVEDVLDKQVLEVVTDRILNEMVRPVTSPEEARKSVEVMSPIENSPDSVYADIGSFKKVFKDPKNASNKLLSSLKALYSFSTALEVRPDDICTTFLNDLDETVWQQIAYRNKQISKEFKRYKSLLDSKAELPFMSASPSDSEEPLDNVMDEHFENGDFDEIGVDYFEPSEDDEPETGTSEPCLSDRKFPKTPVDDKFFSLVEMNAFLDEQDRCVGNEDSFLDTVADETWGSPTNYRYNDFFGKLDVATSESVQNKPKKRKAVDEGVNIEKKSVRFAIEDHQDDELDVSIAEEPILLGEDVDLQKEDTKLKKKLNKLKDTIKKLEEENLQSRSWELSGEVSANDREDNTLLEKYVQFDHGAKKAPEITEDFTEKLESIILQRIEDKTFDDVVRKKKSEERADTYRNEAIEEQEMMKKSLTEVYEKEYQQAAGQSDAGVKSNEDHALIEKRMRELFRLVDALSHFEYTPPEVRPEVRVVNNMSAVRAEEVGMMASTDAQLLAPEEIRKRQKGELKTSDERDKTDKLRERRKKKNKQRTMVMVMGEQALAGQLEKKKAIALKKSGSKDAGSGEKLKSSNFFNQLQETAKKEIVEKTTKKKKVKSLKADGGSSKFKL